MPCGMSHFLCHFSGQRTSDEKSPKTTSVIDFVAWILGHRNGNEIFVCRFRGHDGKGKKHRMFVSGTNQGDDDVDGYG